MLLSCPSCQRQLNVPNDAGGKNIRCPLCQSVFAVPVASVPTPAVPIAPVAKQSVQEEQPRMSAPSQDDPYRGEAQADPFRFDDAHAGGRDDEEFDFSQASPGASNFYLSRAASRLIFAAVLVPVAILFDAAMDTIHLARVIGPFADTNLFLRFLIVVTVMLVIAAPFVVFMGIGASFLRRGVNRGLVITGAIMSIVLGALCAIRLAFAFFLLIMLASRNIDSTSLVIVLLRLLVACGVAYATLSTGIRTLMVLRRPDVERAFERGERERRY